MKLIWWTLVILAVVSQVDGLHIRHGRGRFVKVTSKEVAISDFQSTVLGMVLKKLSDAKNQNCVKGKLFNRLVRML